MVFRSAIAGVFLFFVARLLVLLANALTPAIGASWKAIVPLDYSGTAAVTLALAAVLPLMVNRLPQFDRFRAQRKPPWRLGTRSA